MAPIMHGIHAWIHHTRGTHHDYLHGLVWDVLLGADRHPTEQHSRQRIVIDLIERGACRDKRDTKAPMISALAATALLCVHGPTRVTVVSIGTCSQHLQLMLISLGS